MGMNEVLRREFPLRRPEVGLLLGNGTVGAMIWGQENVLRITLNRSDFWLHRSPPPLSAAFTYKKVREEGVASGAIPELGDAAELSKTGRKATRSTLLPLGRIDLVFPRDAVLKTGYLHLKNGKVVIDIGEGGASYQISCYIAMDKPLIDIHFPPNRELPKVQCVTAWEFSAERLETLGLERPVVTDEQGMVGWVQKRPHDPPLCTAASAASSDIYIALRYGDSPDKARDRVRAMLDKAKKVGYDAIRTPSATYWANHWRWVPHIEIPNESLSFLYYYGTYLFASVTAPGGVVPTRYGPWIDEKAEAPFEGGYSGGINLRLCYWPALRANLMHHCKALFTMVESWKERLAESAKQAYDVDGGALMSASVDDRCVRLGSSWADMIDPSDACLVADLMYRYYLYTQDLEFLRATAYPFMIAVMRVYERMLEKRDDRLELPVTFAPVFRRTRAYAQGKNASFHLAAVHFLCEALLASAAALGEEPKKLWEDVRASLPKIAECEVTVEGGVSRHEAGVFEGVPIDASNGFHGHFAGLWPFDTIDKGETGEFGILTNAADSWIEQGMGAWSSESLPWAAAIHTRFRNADIAEVLLEVWGKLFVNEGHAPVRNPLFDGFTVVKSAASTAPGEMLSFDAGMGVTGAILELLLHTRRGVNVLFAGAPERWKNVSFDNIRTEGAFEVGATRRNGRVLRVSVKANAQGVFRLANPWSGKATLQRIKGTSSAAGAVLEIPMAADERIELSEG
jgi:alpha-L-fucosidase 2